MAKTSPAAPAPAASTPDDRDWPARATETIVEQVQKIRDKTTGPALTAAHWAVYAAFAVSLGTVALIVFLIMVFRFVDIWVPEQVWAAYTVVGSVFLLSGLVLYRVKVVPARRP